MGKFQVITPKAATKHFKLLFSLAVAEIKTNTIKINK